MILRLDEQYIVIRLVCLGILLILNALFSAAEALLARLTRADILEFAEEGGKRYEVLTSLLHHPRRYSLTIITAKTILMVASVVLFTTFWQGHIILSAVIAVLFLVVFHRIISQKLHPK